MKNNAKIFSLPFLRHEQVAHNTYSFFFDRSKTSFTFLPGQYIRMTLRHPQSDDRGTNRYFTIASSPLEREYLMVTTKMIQSTFKETLHNLKKGEPVHFFGPMGKFVFDEKDTRERVFIAGGVGVTPFHSMLTYVAKKHLSIPITLIACFKTEEEVIFYDDLTRLTKTHKNLQIIYTIQTAKKWKGETGKISEKLLIKYIPDLQNIRFAIVGSPTMVERTKELLELLSIKRSNIVTEDFTGY